MTDLKEYGTLQEALEAVEKEYGEDIAEGNEVFIFVGGNKKTGHRYVVTNDSTKRPKGWRSFTL